MFVSTQVCAPATASVMAGSVPQVVGSRNRPMLASQLVFTAAAVYPSRHLTLYVTEIAVTEASKVGTTKLTSRLLSRYAPTFASMVEETGAPFASRAATATYRSLFISAVPGAP